MTKQDTSEALEALDKFIRKLYETRHVKFGDELSEIRQGLTETPESVEGMPDAIWAYEMSPNNSGRHGNWHEGKPHKDCQDERTKYIRADKQPSGDVECKNCNGTGLDFINDEEGYRHCRCLRIEALTDELEEVIADTHDIDINNRDYATAIVNHLKEKRII